VKEPHKILAALWFQNATNYMDRTAMAFAGPILLSTLGMSTQALGVVISAFGIGYTLAQIPGGVLADRWGARVVLVLTPLAWGLATGATTLMTVVGGFIAIRLCLGVAEGLSASAAFKLVGDTFPGGHRTAALAVSSTAAAVGPAVAAPLIGGVIATYGWKAAFVVLAIPAIISAGVNLLVLPGPPREAASGDFSTPRLDEPRVSGFAMLRMSSLWIFMLAYFAFNIAFWGFNGWMPTYLAKAHHLDMKHLGMLGSLPYLAGFVGLLAIAGVATVFHRWRAPLLMITYALAGASLYFAFAARDLLGAMTGLSCAAFLLHGGVPLFGSLMLELAPSAGRATYTGVVFTAGQIGGVIAPVAIGILAQRSGNFASGFALMEVALIAAAAVIALLAVVSSGPVKQLGGLAGPSVRA
jgi:ACS family hexuronate transporter-like MFS transporter